MWLRFRHASGHSVDRMDVLHTAFILLTGLVLVFSLPTHVAAQQKKPAFDLDPGQVQVLKGHDGKVWAVAVHPSGSTVYSGGQDKSVRTWPLIKGTKDKEQKLTAFGADKAIRHLEFLPPVKSAPSGKVKSTGSSAVLLAGETLWVADLASSKAASRLSEGIIAVAVSSDGRLVAGSYHPDMSLLIRNTQAGWKPARIQLQSKASAVGLNADGTTVVVNTDEDSLRAYDTKTGKVIQRLKGQPGLVQSIVVLPDGNRILSAGHANEVYLWNLATGAVVAKFPGHDRGVARLAVTPDGTRFIAASGDGVLRVWDIAEQKLVAELKGHEGAILSVAVAPNGMWVATAGSDETVRLFGLPK